MRPTRIEASWARRLLASPDAVTAAWGLLLGGGICWPLLSGRPVFLLDWVTGPHPPMPSPAMLGLQGGLTAGVLDQAVLTGLVRVIGGAATWLPLLAMFPLASWAIGRLVGGRALPRITAATLYCVNPWVFNRVFVGQVPLLVGYALLPLAVRSALDAPPRRRATLLGPALWWAALTALSPHYAWIFGVVMAAAAAVSCPRSWTGAALRVGWLAINAAGFTVTSLYILLPHLSTKLPIAVGPHSLAIFRTTGDPHLGLFPNVLGLYGFWRTGPGPTMAKNVVKGWPLLLLALLVVIVRGYVAALRSTDPGRRRLGWLLVLVGVAGYFLALGDQGPTGPLFRWTYDNVPFFAVMREPEKFLMLLALAYAAGLGWGVERLAAGAAGQRVPAPGSSMSSATAPGELEAGIATAVARDGAPDQPAPPDRRRWRPTWTAAAVGLLLPLAYTPTIFDGLAGQIAPSTLPAAYAQADALMGTGQGKVLYLPWHLYEAQPFTAGRVIATIGPTAFRRQVIAGDNVQVGSVQTESTSLRSAYIQQLLDHGPSLHHFGARVAPLGVAYVVLAHTVDWPTYRWLDFQSDLRPVLADGTLQVWRNLAYVGAGQRTGARGTVRELSPVAFAAPPGSRGTVVVDAAYQLGWVFDGRPGHPTPDGTVRFAVDSAAGGVAQFAPWGQVRLGYELSLGSVLLLAIAVLADRHRTGRRRARE